MFDFIYSWKKETVKQKGSVAPNVMKRSLIFIFVWARWSRKISLIQTIYQSITRVLQYHDSSPDKPRDLLLAPTGVASINVYHALGTPCCGRLYPLDSNSLTSLCNKCIDVQLIISGETPMVLKILLHQIHQHLTEIFNVPNILCFGKSILVVGELYQLPPVQTIPVYVSSLDLGE